MTAPRSFFAPGRVNLMGDHTDYNDGYCLPMAIGLGCTATAAPMAPATDYDDGFVLPIAIGQQCSVSAALSGGGSSIHATSEQLVGEAVVPVDGGVDPRSTEPAWGRFVAGVAHALTQHGIRVPAADLQVTSTVPPGSGLSSSSALSVALTLALADLADASLDRIETARIALTGEIAATGVPGGLMDQLASLFGQAGRALLIDCRTLAVTPVPIAPSLAVIVVHSGVPRTLASTDYAMRRVECEAVTHRLGVAALRDATVDQVADDPRARHVVTENARVIATADALASGELAVLGPLLLASHASLRDDFEVSIPELDLLVETLVECGAAGARLTGAGFGGCVVALAQRNHADDIVAKTVLRYRSRTGIEPLAFVAQAVDGAHRAE